MNGIMPGPLWLAIVSAVRGISSLTRNPIHHPKSDTFAEKKADESMLRVAPMRKRCRSLQVSGPSSLVVKYAGDGGIDE